MNVLHYSFSLSSCPKCHLLICKHTSLADLDFNSTQQQLSQSITECNNTTISIENNFKNSYQQRLSHGTNFYIFPSTIFDNRHSWTTFGTDSIESTNTFYNLSSNNETICENIPFANENIINSSLPLIPTLNQIVRTQSERFNNNSQKPIYLTKSFSFSTICNKSSSFSQHEDHSLTKSYSYSTISFLLISILILSFLITNIIDIVLLYIYYHTNYIYLISFISTIILCDIILWMNNIIQLNPMPSCLLLIPFIIRLYLLYELVELLTMIFDKNDKTQRLDSSSSTTFETNISQKTDSSIIHHLSSYKIKKQRLFHYLTLFYHIHTGFLAFINLYFWSNNFFQLSTKSLLNINYFISQWTRNDDLLSLTSTINTITTHSSIAYWQISDNERIHFAHQTMSSNWTQLLSSSSIFVLISILYYLIINYSLLSTFLIVERFSFIIILSILSRLCLIITRIYTFIFLFHLNAWWLLMTFLIVHLTLMIILILDRSKFKYQQNTMFLQIIFSLITHNSIDNISINALISLENISIFLHRLYLETFSFYHNETTLHLIIFISTLILLQIIGFIFHLLSKNIHYKQKKSSYGVY